MKKKKERIKAKKYILLFVGIFFPLTLVYAAFPFNTVLNGFGINTGTEQIIDAHGTCKKVKNNRSDYNIFVPTKIENEWNRFQNSASALNVQVSECAKRIFITSTRYWPDFGGLSQADAICQTRADVAGLGGNWKALISTSTVDARDRLGNDWYNDELVTIDNSVVATKNAGPWAPNYISSQILDEFGAVAGINDNHYAWTGTTGDGTFSGNNCNDWTSLSSSYSVTVGNVIMTTRRWIFNGTPNCSLYAAKRLYCFSD